MEKRLTKYGRVALSVAGSAILLFSCAERETPPEGSVETMMTEYSDSLSIIMSRNGRRSYHFTAPQLEGYTLAREPYREFRRGIRITTYKDDSLSTVDAVLTANYAIYYEKRELWEAKGNVVVEKSDDKTLYTQQLFWNAQTDKVYSNVDSKIVQNNGRDVFIGEGFESDASFKEWRFRRMKGRMEVEMKNSPDSTASAPAPAGAADVAGNGAAGGPDPKEESSGGVKSGNGGEPRRTAVRRSDAGPERPRLTDPAPERPSGKARASEAVRFPAAGQEPQPLQVSKAQLRPLGQSGDAVPVQAAETPAAEVPAEGVRPVESLKSETR